ncbi:MAG: quinone oxidoreductase [Alphaproteobacteria bacterium]|nr:quinone oxidoreductase [Alphaproteobacteria bacterium]
MVKAMRMHKVGGPEVLTWEDVEVPAPKQGEALIRATAVGLNYIDTYHRSGLYPVPMPAIIGSEGAGVVEAVGPGVTEVAVGDRVAYGNGPIGSYAEKRVMPSHRLLKLPASIDDRQAASMMLKGMTAQYLIRRTYRVKAGETVLVHAAAGGVGLIMCQWLKHLGATVIGTAGDKAKAELARKHGADHVILYREEDFAAKVKEITGGKLLPVVFDGVGKDTWEKSLDCLQPRGLMVSYGNASGAVPPINIAVLNTKGSLFLTRPSLNGYVTKRDELVETANDLFDVVAKGAVKIGINQSYALKDAAQAHRDLEARKTTGSTVFTL